MIKELTSLQDDWCIKENKIVATVNESICSKFEKYLEEGKCFYISTFSVGDSQGTPRIVENKNKIHFYKATNVTPCDSYSGSFHGFRFKSFDTLLQVEDQSSMSYDLIGDLISRGTITHAMVDGNRRPYIRLELEDLTGTKLRNITLWGDYALQLNNTLAMSCVVVATVKKIERESDWWYKIPLRVMDSTGSVSLTLFDRQAQPIIDKSAAELL
ncbi:nucleic acid-binding, OB-fold, replication protein A, OB domain protein [Tanacetum coccineum]